MTEITIEHDNARVLPSVVRTRLNHFATLFSPELYELIANYICSSGEQKQLFLTHKLYIYAEVLKEEMNSKNYEKLYQSFTYVRAHAASRTDSLKVFGKILVHFRMLITHLVKHGYYDKSLLSQLDSIFYGNDEVQLESSKNEYIPKSILTKIPNTKSADEEFRSTLKNTCTVDIAVRLEEHVNSFKNKKHHRQPISNFLKQVSLSHPKWYEHPIVIHGELIKFRGNLLDELGRNTAYSRFQNVKNAIEVLVNHGLLPGDVELPDNLRRCTNTEKVRSNNPLICKINLYDESGKNSFLDSRSFINSIKNDLEDNLDILVSTAQSIIHEAYSKFCDASRLISLSQFDDFIELEDHLLLNTKSKAHSKKTKLNPFYKKHPLRLENLTSYYNHFYNELLYPSETERTNKHIAISEDIIPYLGLTTLAASAMQLVITEEIGINPYSLYKIKVTSDGHGLEFIQVDDEGSVRIKALKPRARHSKTRKASGTLTPLNKVEIKEIDASTCIKMALEMTSRARKTLGIKDLWACLTIKGVVISQPDSFQKQFKKIRTNNFSRSGVLADATLKKVRASKGVLIYLKSNGDSLKAATYLGNTVKTTLNRYIPKYLTELVFRVKIRSFQRILLFMSVAGDESPYNSLSLNEEEFKKQVEVAFCNPDMGGNLFGKLTSKTKENSDDKEVYFCVSDNNLKLAIKYAKEGKNKELKKICEMVLQKISESNTSLKLMLRNAQKNTD